MEKLAAKLIDVVIEASTRHVPRGVWADPRQWELDPEVVQAVVESREARNSMPGELPPPQIQASGKAKKKE